MKKNTMMRLASLLLVLTLLSTCAISGTFAKYVSSNSGSDSARVAKWGVTVTAAGTTFAKAYKDAATDVNADQTVRAEASSTVNVVAPGTNGSMAAVALTGTPEVDVRVTYSAVFDFSANWVDSNGAVYCPIVITIGNQKYSYAGTKSTSLDAFETYLNNKVAEYSKNYDANTNLANVGADSLNIGWEWAYEGNNDANDTYLGNQAAANNAATIQVTITCTVTQVD